MVRCNKCKDFIAGKKFYLIERQDNKSGRISTYCKFCYLSIRNKMKKEKEKVDSDNSESENETDIL